MKKGLMMNIQSAYNSGVAGYNQATERVAESANNIAQQQVTKPQTEEATETQRAVSQARPIEESLINLRVAENEARTSANVIETADEVIGSLIDTRV